MTLPVYGDPLAGVGTLKISLYNRREMVYAVYVPQEKRERAPVQISVELRAEIREAAYFLRIGISEFVTQACLNLLKAKAAAIRRAKGIR